MDFGSVVFLTLTILVSFILGFKITYHIVNRERERALNEQRMVRNIELIMQGYLKTDNDKLTKEDEAE